MRRSFLLLSKDRFPRAFSISRRQSNYLYHSSAFEQLECRALLAGSPVITTTTLNPISTTETAATVKDPQSKVWQHDGQWWTVFALSTGTWLFRMDGKSWTPILKFSASKFSADVEPVGDGTIVHVFMFNASATSSSKLGSVQYVPGSPGTYELWQVRTALSSVMTSGASTGTIDIDSTGRMWLATDTDSTIEARYSDYPYSSWSGPITLASGVGTISDGSSVAEISAVIALPNHTIGVMWSNHTTGRFGFRVHVDGANTNSWSADEAPAAQSAQNVGHGMADDHIHLAVSQDGTLFAAVKTAFDKNKIAQPEIALLVRHPAAGVQPAHWDPMYGIDAHGTRPIDVVNDSQDYVLIAYAGDTGVDDIVYKAIPFASLDPNNSTQFFNAPRQTLLGGANLKNASSQRGTFSSDLVLIATGVPNANSFNVSSVRIASAVVQTPWQNSDQPLDVNNDNNVSAIDVLTVINALNQQGAGPLPSTNPNNNTYIDVSGDGFLAPQDALLVINALNAQAGLAATAIGLAAGAEQERSVAFPASQKSRATAIDEALLHLSGNEANGPAATVDLANASTIRRSAVTGARSERTIAGAVWDPIVSVEAGESDWSLWLAPAWRGGTA